MERTCVITEDKWILISEMFRIWYLRSLDKFMNAMNVGVKMHHGQHTC